MNTFSPFFLRAIAVMGLASLAGAEVPALEVTARKARDRVDVQMNADGAVFNVKSSDGIGDVRITSTNGVWPERAVVRLNVRMLEVIRVATPQLRITSSLGAVGRGSASLAQLAPGVDPANEGKPIEPGSAYWLPIRKQGDHVEIELPKALFSEKPASISISWIDAYR